MKDAIQGNCRENRVLGATKKKLMPSCTRAVFRPRVWPPQGKPVEMALIRKNQLLWLEIGLDENLVVNAVLLVSLQSNTCDLCAGLRSLEWIN
jgi:hypothetical protein